MTKKRTKLFTAIGLSTVLLLGAASAYAAQKEENKVVQTTVTKQAPTAQEIEAVLKGEPKPESIKVEGLFSRKGEPDHTADFYLNDERLLSLLQMTAQQLKDELATGKSVAELAASRHISKEQLVAAVTKTQVDVQVQAEQKGAVPTSKRSSMKKDIEKKAVQVIEHKTESDWKK